MIAKKYYYRLLVQNLLSRQLRECHHQPQTPIATTKLDSTEFHSIFTPELKYVLNIFQKNGFEIRIAGGAVRDLLLNKVPKDVDLATTANPREMINVLDENYIRLFNYNGLTHATLPIRVNDAVNFEITSTRYDVVEGGRRVRCVCTRDWRRDAARRDFTMNSLFLDEKGTVYDYNGTGISDARDGRIRFTDAIVRIQEDPSRILRYFRFFSKYSKDQTDHDQAGLEAIAKCGPSLAQVSTNRIWPELITLALGRNAGPALKMMLGDGHRLGEYIGFKGELNLAELDRLWALKDKYENFRPNGMTLMTSLFDSQDQLRTFYQTQQIPRKYRLLSELLVAERGKSERQPKADAYMSLYVQLRDFTEPYRNEDFDLSILRKDIVQLMMYDEVPEPEIEAFLRTDPPRFPCSPRDFWLIGAPREKGYTARYRNYLHEKWTESGYTLLREELLKELGNLVTINKTFNQLPVDLDAQLMCCVINN